MFAPNQADPRVTVDSVLRLETSPGAFRLWLEAYQRHKHPHTEPSVTLSWDDDGTVDLCYYAPDFRIVFTGHMVTPDVLALTKVTYPQRQEDYGQDLLEAVRTTWQASPSLPGFVRVLGDEDLATVLKLRWEESTRALTAEAYLAATILLGSILEGVLLAYVQQHPAEANQAAPAPKKDGKVRPFSEWTLNHLIEVAHHCGWIGTQVKDFSGVLRDYRNLIHPREQVAKGVYPDASTCKMAQLIVEMAVSHLLN
jgi:hypothetical protein